MGSLDIIDHKSLSPTFPDINAVASLYYLHSLFLYKEINLSTLGLFYSCCDS